jgi:ABC-type sugar transport system, permease component
MKNGRLSKAIGFVLVLALALLFIAPLGVLIMNSFKPLNEIMGDPLAWPTEWKLGNYSNAWTLLDIPNVVKNTAILSFGAVALIVLLASMTAYWSERHPTPVSRIFGQLILLSILIPFATIMLPLVQVMRFLHLNNTLGGAILAYAGIGLAFAYFLIRSGVKSLPYELEEAAQIDGSGQIRLFFQIVLPLLAPTLFSVFIMDMFWVWNDFLIPMILLNNESLSTIQLAVNRLFGMYSSRWDVAMPALTMSMLPIIIIFVLLQRKIVGGVMAGAIKG